MTVESSFLIAGAFVTNAAFVLAAVALYDLSVEVIKNERMAYISCLLFCYNLQVYSCLQFIRVVFMHVYHSTGCYTLSVLLITAPVQAFAIIVPRR